MPTDWLQCFERGVASVQEGPDEHAAELGIRPSHCVKGGYGLQGEIVFHAAYREWVRRLSSNRTLAAE